MIRDQMPRQHRRDAPLRTAGRDLDGRLWDHWHDNPQYDYSHMTAIVSEYLANLHRELVGIDPAGSTTPGYSDLAVIVELFRARYTREVTIVELTGLLLNHQVQIQRFMLDLERKPRRNPKPSSWDGSRESDTHAP